MRSVRESGRLRRLRPTHSSGVKVRRGHADGRREIDDGGIPIVRDRPESSAPPEVSGPTADAAQAGLGCVMERIWSVATTRIRTREHRQAAGKALRDKYPRPAHDKVLLGHGDTRDLIALFNASTEGPVEELLSVRHGRPRERANPGSSRRQEFAERSRVRRTHAARAEQLRNRAVDRLGASVRLAQKGTHPHPQRGVVAAVHACCG
jgi:hypothetical protein